MFLILINIRNNIYFNLNTYGICITYIISKCKILYGSKRTFKLSQVWNVSGAKNIEKEINYNSFHLLKQQKKLIIIHFTY